MKPKDLMKDLTPEQEERNLEALGAVLIELIFNRPVFDDDGNRCSAAWTGVHKTRRTRKAHVKVLRVRRCEGGCFSFIDF